MTYLKHFLILLIILSGLKAGAAELQGPDFNFVHINTETGLPSNRVRDIVQDSDGFMWFATDGGLVRYDGRNSKVFIPENPDKISEEVFVMTLAPYRNGLLVGTDKGLYGYDSELELLAPLSLIFNNQQKGLLKGNVKSIAVESDDSFWVSVDNEGLYNISPEGAILNLFTFPESHNYISQVFVDDAENVWAIYNSHDGYIYKFDKKNSTFKNFPLIIDGQLRDVGGSTIMRDDQGDYWLGTWNEGLIKFNGRSGESQRYCQDDKVPIWHIHSITQFSPGLLLVGSDNGLMLLDADSGDCCLYLYDELNPESISGQFVYPITMDSEGGLWIGTYYRGINYLGKSSARFHNWHHSSYKNSVAGSIVTRLCEDPSGKIWIGSADGGLCSYDPKTRKFTPYQLNPAREYDNVNALCSDGKKLWVGMYSGGVGYLDIETGRWTPVAVEGEKNISCYAIFKDDEGNIWMGATQTLAKYNPEKRVFEKVSNLKSWINDIKQDKSGNLWISTQGGGLFRYNPDTKIWKNFKNTGEAGCLPHNHINNIALINNNVFVSTPKGVYLYEPLSGYFQPVPGFPDGIAANAVEESGKDLWISSNVGLILLDSEGRSRNFTASDGLGENQFFPGASLAASNGMLYFGHVNGFSGVNPSAVVPSKDTPKVKFTALNIVDQPIEVGNPHLPSSLNSIKQLELDNSDHTFTIFFSALSYDNPGGNSYRYKLDGFDKTWHDPKQDNSATYSNLPPGTYTFRVRAANSDGVWNDDGIELKIVVRPVWYMSTLMKLLYLLIALTIMVVALRYVLWRIERNHNRELQKISDNKEKEMFRSKFNFFTVVAHEIRTPVSLIIGPLEKIMSSGEKFSNAVKSDLQVIERNARRLLALVNQLLDYKKVEDSPLPIGFRHGKIVTLIENILERFRPSLESKGIKINVDFPDPDLEVDVDPEAITKLVSNLITNAMKFTKDTITVKCLRIADTDKFEIVVADNGVGISKENSDKVFNPFFQVLDNINDAKGGTGLGLSIVKSVVDAHGGEIKLVSEPGHGASFTVILPIKQENVLRMAVPDEALQEEKNEDISPDEDAEETIQDPVLLVVDDNAEMVDFISSHYEKNYEVITASNGAEALEKMKEKPVSLIICDWMMPVMDGEEFLRKIRHDENFSHIPFVMLTAKTDNASKITTMKSGADAYVEKPFSISYLDARIENLLDMRELLRRKFSRMPLEPITSIAQTEVDNELLKKLQALIEDNFSNPELNVDFLAEHLGISRSGLYAKIKALADVTPNELIQITRLKKAAELLKENKYRINEICYMVGFNSSSYFSRCFQKQFGMKPGEFASS